MVNYQEDSNGKGCTSEIMIVCGDGFSDNLGGIDRVIGDDDDNDDSVYKF